MFGETVTYDKKDTFGVRNRPTGPRIREVACIQGHSATNSERTCRLSGHRSTVLQPLRLFWCPTNHFRNPPKLATFINKFSNKFDAVLNEITRKSYQM